MAENKTQPTRASVAAYIASRANAAQKADCRELMAMLRKLTGKTPRMWGPSIVGYGNFHYRLPSGRTGEIPLASLAIRGRDLVVYIGAEGRKQKALLSKLGKHSIGKSCLYIRHLDDVDRSVLEKLIVGSIAEMKERWSPAN